MGARCSLGALAIALAAAGCALPDPCPSGLTLKDDRCWPGDAGREAADSSTPNSEDTPDAQQDLEAGDGFSDATLDASAEPGEEPGAASETDASEEDAVQSSCSPPEQNLWRNFQLSGRLTMTISDCISEINACHGSKCDDIGECVQHAAEVSDCQACIANETICLMNTCSSECKTPDAYDSCRRCACAHGCSDPARGCDPEALAVCTDCDDRTCPNQSVAPSLVLQIFNVGTIIAPMP